MGEKVPSWDCLYVYKKLGLLRTVYVDAIKMVGKTQNLRKMWKSTGRHWTRRSNANRGSIVLVLHREGSAILCSLQRTWQRHATMMICYLQIILDRQEYSLVSAVKLCSNAYTWRELECLICYGKSTFWQNQSQDEVTRVTKDCAS